MYEYNKLKGSECWPQVPPTFTCLGTNLMQGLNKTTTTNCLRLIPTPPLLSNFILVSYSH